MALSVKVSNPAFPDDTEFSVNGLGLFVNGQEREVTEQEEKAFISETGELPADALDHNASFEVTGTPEVATLSDVYPAEISDRPPLDPTAMNLDENGEIFAEANLNGKASDPDEVVMAEEQQEEEEETVTEETPPDAPVDTPAEEGGGN